MCIRTKRVFHAKGFDEGIVWMLIESHLELQTLFFGG